MLQAWKEQALNIVISKLHNDVSGNLDVLKVPHENEFLTEDQLFSIDIALEDQKVAIEVDGPFHFSANTHEILGRRSLQLPSGPSRGILFPERILCQFKSLLLLLAFHTMRLGVPVLSWTGQL